VTVVADMGRPEDAVRAVQETVERLGSVDVLVHSAGGVVVGGLFDVDPATWHAAFDVHVHALYYLCRTAIPSMKTRGGGAIVMISSVAGLRGVHFNLAYQVVKGTDERYSGNTILRGT